MRRLQKEKVRVYNLAHDLGMDTKELLQICKQAGFDVKNQLSTLDGDQQKQLEQILSNKGAAAPAAPVAAAKPVTPVVAPDAKAVPTIKAKRSAKREVEALVAAEPEAVEPEAPALDEAAALVAEMEVVEEPVLAVAAPVEEAPAAPVAPVVVKPVLPKEKAIPVLTPSKPSVKKPVAVEPVVPVAAEVLVEPVVVAAKPAPTKPAPAKPAPVKPALPEPLAPAATVKPVEPELAAPKPTPVVPAAVKPALVVPAAAKPAVVEQPAAAIKPTPAPFTPRPTLTNRPSAIPNMQSTAAKSPPDLGNRPGPTGSKPGTTPAAPSSTGPVPAKPLGAPPLKKPAARAGYSHLQPIAQPSRFNKQQEAPKPKEVASGPKQLQKFTLEQLERMRTGTNVNPTDILKPQAAPVVPGEIEDDEDGGKGKDKSKKTSLIPGRDQRQKDRNKRAEERKKEREQQMKLTPGRILTDEEEQHVRTLKHLRGKQHQRKMGPVVRSNKIEVETPLTVRALSEAMGVRSGELLFKLMGHGAPKGININSTIDASMAELLAIEYGKELTIKRPASSEHVLLEGYHTEGKPEDMVPRAPVVTIMGHVDHGKTSLLDRIRESNIVDTEAGGITQVIRAWRVERNGHPVTFLDTPGHEAFTKMRARGAQVTDIAVIVVAADDGVMPQTEEAINHAKAAGVSLVVAINKVDMPSANVVKTRQQLYSLGVLPDNMGGDTPFVETSAATGKGIEELLDQLSLVAELKELKANPNVPAKGTCLEAMLSEGEGVQATMLVREGTLRRGDILLCGATYGRIRQMYNDQGKPIDEAGPSVPVRVIGLNEVPNADDAFQLLPDLSVAREIADQRKSKQVESAQTKRQTVTFESMAQGKIEELKVILKADFRGSVEAIKKELEKLDHKEVKLKLLHAGIGAITESDVQLALTSPDDTLVVGFNAVPDDRALAMAEERGIKIREYDIIYNLTNDIKAALEGKLKPREEVVHLGRAVVRETFRISKTGTIAGCYVTQGSIKRNAKIRVIRDGVVIYPPAEKSAGLDSLKRFKDDSGEVREGFECGIKVAGYDDIKVGDVIEAFRIDQIQRTLE